MRHLPLRKLKLLGQQNDSTFQRCCWRELVAKQSAELCQCPETVHIFIPYQYIMCWTVDQLCTQAVDCVRQLGQ